MKRFRADGGSLELFLRLSEWRRTRSAFQPRDCTIKTSGSGEAKVSFDRRYLHKPTEHDGAITTCEDNERNILCTDFSVQHFARTTCLVSTAALSNPRHPVYGECCKNIENNIYAEGPQVPPAIRALNTNPTKEGVSLCQRAILAVVPRTRVDKSAASYFDIFSHIVTTSRWIPWRYVDLQ